MALRYQRPPGLEETQYPDVGGALDKLYNAYLQNRQYQDSRTAQGLGLAEKGIDPTSIGMQSNPAFGPLLERWNQAQAQSAKTRGLENQKTQAEINKLNMGALADGRQAGVGKQLPPASVLSVNEGLAVTRMLPEVRQAIQENKGSFGPVAGLAGLNPYATGAKTIDARMRTASQAFGRYMEGGVLRKEDEEKYRKMFPQLTDTPDVAENKLSIAERMLAQKFQSDKGALQGSGYDVSGLGDVAVPQSLFGQGQQAPRKIGRFMVE